MKEREPLLIVVTGSKGVGKTYTTIKIIKQYVIGNIVTGTPPRRVIILDVNDEYTEFKAIALKDVKKFSHHPKIECRRVRIIKPDGNKMSLTEIQNALAFILDNFKGGLLVIEDISKYTSPNMGMELIGSLCTQRHVDCDIIIHYQSVGRAATPSIVSNMNIMRLHKTTDKVERHENKFGEYSEILHIAENLVNNRYYKEMDKRGSDNLRNYFDFYVYVDFNRNKIYGKFQRDEFKEAITEYIQENEGSTIGKLLKKKDRKGKVLYNYEQALIASETQLLNKYYGNN
jgi:dephospho-CoA kinase